MRFVCESCRAQYMINDEKVGPKGVKVRCRKCGYVILVKRTDVAVAVPPPPPPPSLSDSDSEDDTATQVMESPLHARAVGPAATAVDASSGSAHDDGGSADGEEPKTVVGDFPARPAPASPSPAPARVAASAPARPPPSEGNGAGIPRDSLFGMDDDEIGAVFDQVLKSPGAPQAASAEEKRSEDRENTRVIDAGMVRKLAAESGVTLEGKPVESSNDEVPQADWYVAIDEKQTGPLSLDKLKELWDRGEVGADSLCWRAGFDDWIPLSEVKALASVLAPKPPKPIVVAPPVAAGAPAMGAVVSVPVQSAFSAGGLMQTVQSEVQVPMGAASAQPEESGDWRPSAASALASLVKEELEVLAKPPAPKKPEPADEVAVRSLLEVPSAENKAGESGPAQQEPKVERAERPDAEKQRDRPPRNPYLANAAPSYGTPAVTQYRPPTSRTFIVAIGAVVLVLVAAVVGLGVLVLTRQPVVVQQGPPAQVAQAGPPAPAVAPGPPVTPQPAPTAAPQPPPTNVVPPPQPTTAPSPASAIAAPQPERPRLERPVRREVQTARAEPPEQKRVEKAVEKPAEKPAKKGDEFDELFGGGGSSAGERKKEEPETSKPKSVFVPPPPGQGAEVKDTLSQGDIFEVVKANFGQFAKCAEEQRRREPGVSGTLRMKWTVGTNGKASNISCDTAEFKATFMASCAGGAIRALVFPRSKNPGDPVTVPFKF